MATEAKEKKPAKDKGGDKGGKPEKAPKAKKAPKTPEAAPVAAAPEPPKAPPAPRPPADPRLKVLKKFRGKFLPKGILRERHKAIMTRWDSGEDHGNVSVDELKSLLDDWRGTQEIPPRKPKA